MNKGLEISKIQVTVTIVLFLMFSVTGATFAYFAVSAEDTNTITGDAATVNLTLDVNRVFPTSTSANTGVMVPQLSVSGSNSSPLSNALKSGCVDGNGHVVCKVYKIDIANIGGSAVQVVDGFISFYGNTSLTTDVGVTMPSLRWKLIDSVNVTTPGSSVLGTDVDKAANFNDNVFADDITLGTNDSETYYIIIWVNETNSDQPTDEGKSFYAKIEFNSFNGTGVTSTFVP